MSEKRILVLLAGGYSAAAVQKHLLSIDGLPLFERIINAVPADTVWIAHNKWNQGWWTNWLHENKDTTFKDKIFGIYVDHQSAKGESSNPALWMTSNVPVYLAYNRISEVIFSAIDSYFKNFNFMDELMKQEHAIVVAKGRSGRTLVDLSWRGNINTMFKAEPVDEKEWGFTDMFKTTVKRLSEYGQMSKGNMASVVVRMMEKGTEFNAVKAKGAYMDCGTPEGLDKAKSLYRVETKVW